MAVRASWWSITINNPTSEDRASLIAPPDFVREMWYQDEIGKERGTLHIQMALNTTQQRVTAIKGWLPRARIEVARNYQALKNYCKKSDTAVADTFVHYSVVASVPEEEDRADPMVETLMLLVSFIRSEDDVLEGTSDPDKLYATLISRIVRIYPEFISRLTAMRVQASFRYSWMEFYNHLLNAENLAAPDELQLDRQTGWIHCCYSRHPDCNDETYICKECLS